MLTTLARHQAQTQTQTQESDRIDGIFDSAIGLPPQSQKPEYLAGYYGSGNVPF